MRTRKTAAAFLEVHFHKKEKYQLPVVFMSKKDPR
jgi:hypothetical protein